MNRCPICTKDMDLVGRSHNCVPVATPSKEEVRADYKKMGKAMNAAMIGDVASVASVASCPVCETRRQKQLEAQRRYRSKKITK
jgi:hypothetical protein